MATPEEMAESVIRNLKEKTGKTLEEWLKVVKASKLAKHGEIVKNLKDEFGIGHGYANTIAHKALAREAPAEGDALVEAQYAGPKAVLRPIYESLISQLKKLGKDIEVSPKKTYVSLRRSKQFALIQPSTATRIDVGINLKDVPPTKRLEDSGSFNAMVSHRVRLETAADVDAELLAWLKKAYEAA
jgi:predicted transport protein